MKYILIFSVAFTFIIAGCGSGENKPDESIAYYTCPMHPEIKEDRPGSCPICGMDLTPVKHDGHDEDEPEEHRQTEPQEDQVEAAPEATLRIAPVQQQIIGMQYDTVQTRHLQTTTRTVGRIVPDERKVTEVTLRVMGYVEKTHVNETGALVRRGQPLVTVYSPDLVSSQQDYLVTLKGDSRTIFTRNDGENPERTLNKMAQRGRERLRLLNMPESEIRRLEQEGEPLLEVTLEAPYDGFIIKKEVRDGIKFMPGMMLYEIADLSTVWLIADVYEDDIPFIYENQTVQFTLQGNQGNQEGRVTFIPPSIDPMTRTLPVRIEIPNRDGRIKVDQFGWVTFVQDLDKRLSVHRDAVLITGKRAIVYKTVGRGRFAPVEVHLGPLAEEYYEVLHGLEEGDRVVTSGRFFLDAESRLRGVGAMAGHGH
jgi:membrane fusion protein, copper/silver efflux system